MNLGIRWTWISTPHSHVLFVSWSLQIMFLYARTQNCALKWESVRHTVFLERGRSWVFLLTGIQGNHPEPERTPLVSPLLWVWEDRSVVQKYVHHRVGLAGKTFASSEACMLLSISNTPEALLNAKISPLSSSIGNWCSPCSKDI